MSIEEGQAAQPIIEAGNALVDRLKSPSQRGELRRLYEIERASRDLADFIWKSVNVGPLTKAPNKEARLWRSLRTALDRSQEGAPTP